MISRFFAALLGLLCVVGVTSTALAEPRIYVDGYPNILDNAIEHNRQGTQLMKLERYLEAGEEFQAAIKLNPYSGMAASLYNNLGSAYLHLQQYPLAVASFQYALRIQPDYGAYYNNLIDAYIESGVLDQAMAELQAITGANDENAEAYYLLSLIYKEKGEPELANLCLNQFKKIKPYSPLSQSSKNNPKKSDKRKI